jgi:hypothetical protein
MNARPDGRHAQLDGMPITTCNLLSFTPGLGFLLHPALRPLEGDQRCWDIPVPRAGEVLHASST